MATVGQSLNAPEEGWKRIEDTDNNFQYTGTWTRNSGLNSSQYYNGTSTYSSTVGDKVKFRFYGTKLRILSQPANNKSSNIPVVIDGVNKGTYGLYSATSTYQVIVFEAANLLLGLHDVEITVPSGTPTQLLWDSIDIDADGEMVRYFAPNEVTDIKDLTVGKRIRAHYASGSNTYGVFSNFGKVTSDLISTLSTATPNGDFYFIMVEDWNGKKRLIADRHIQHTISWDALNQSGAINGHNIQLTLTPFDNAEIKNITSSPGYGINTADKLFDKEYTIHWNAEQDDSNGNTYVTIELREPKLITAFAIRGILTISGSSYGLRDYKIFGSNDNINFVELYNGSHANNGVDEYKAFNNKSKYLFYRFESLNSWYSGKRVVFSEIEYFTADYETMNKYKATLRLLTGGISSTDKDNEWDKYIVNSTLNGTVTAGDDSVWNWTGGIYDWTSTSPSTNTLKVIRGATSAGAWNTATTSASNTTLGFRPVLEIEGIFDKSDLVGRLSIPGRKKNNLPSHINIANTPIPYNKQDQWIDFDSSKNQYLQTTNADFLKGSFTVDFWTYVKSYTNWGRFFDLNQGVVNANTNGVLMALATTGKLRFQYFNGTTSIVTIDSSVVVPLNSWNHIAVTYSYDTGISTIYLNGASVGTVTNATTKIPQIVRTNMYVGRSPITAESYLNAKMNELRFWDNAKTGAEILQMAKSPNTTTGYEDGLSHYWGFDLTNLYEIDSSILKYVWDTAVSGNPINLQYLGGTIGTSDSIISANEIKSIISAKTGSKNDLSTHMKVVNPIVPYNGIDYWIDLNSVNKEYLEVPDATWLNGDFTVDFWTYMKSQTTYMRFINMSTTSGSTSNYWGIAMSGTKFNVTAYNSTATIFTLTSNDNVPLNTWVHIAVTYDYIAGKTTLYLNGVETASATIATKVPQNVARTNAFIGRSYLSTEPYLNAKLNEFRIWNVAKTKDEVADMMYRKADGYELNLSHLWNFELNNLYETQPTIQKYIGDAVQTNKVNLPYFGGTIESIGIGALDFPSKGYVVNRTNMSSHIKVHSQKPYDFTDKWINLDSTKSQYLQGQAGNWLQGSWTVEFQTYTKSYTNYAKFLELNIGSTDNNIITIDQSATTGKLRFMFFNATGTAIMTLISSTALPIGAWTHVAVTYDYDTGIANIYQNGVLVVTGVNATKIPQMNRTLYIGKSYNTGVVYLNAKLDDYRIWNVAKTQEEIIAIMNKPDFDGYEKGLTQYWNFEFNNANETTGATIYDVTPTMENLTFYGGSPMPLETDTVTKAANELESKTYVLNRSELTSNMYINPHGLMAISTTIVQMNFEKLPSTINIKNVADMASTISVKPWGMLTMKIDIVPPPRYIASLTVKDAFVRSSVPRLNYGTTGDMLFGYDHVENEYFRSLIGFDMASVPSGQRIEKAVMKLYFDLDATEVMDVELCEVDLDWTEYGVTWVNQPSATNVLKTFKVGDKRGYIEIDMLDKVKEWYSGVTVNKGFIIRSKDETKPLVYRFYTRESAKYKPLLEVTYYDPSPKSVDTSTLDNCSMIVRQNKSKDLNGRINIKSNYTEDDQMKGHILVINWNKDDETGRTGNRPELDSHIGVRWSMTDDQMKGKIAIRRNMIADPELKGKIFSNNPDLKITGRVRQTVRDDRFTGKIAVKRYSDRPTVNPADQMTGKGFVSRPELISTLKVFYYKALPSTIIIPSKSQLTSKIAVRQSDKKDMVGTIKVLKNEDLPSHIQVLSGYLKSNIIVPWDKTNDLRTYAKIQVIFISDIECRFITRRKDLDNAYAFIM